MVVSPETFPFMVVGNKTDREDARVISKEKAEHVVKEMGDEILHVETSAKDNVNVANAFSQLAKQALKRQQSITRKADDSSSSKRAFERERLKQLNTRKLSTGTHTKGGPE